MPLTYSVVVPTCRAPSELREYMVGIIEYTACPLMFTCLRVSAACNRNHGLNMVKTDLVIQADDDVGGFYRGWEADLVAPLLADPHVQLVSARLLNPDGSMQNVFGNVRNLTDALVPVKFAPGACCAWRNNGLRFDESYKGSGFEDTDFIMQLNEKYPGGKIYINNHCRLNHRNEMKQQSMYYAYNSERFRSKWGYVP